MVFSVDFPDAVGRVVEFAHTDGASNGQATGLGQMFAERQVATAAQSVGVMRLCAAGSFLCTCHGGSVTQLRTIRVSDVFVRRSESRSHGPEI